MLKHGDAPLEHVRNGRGAVDKRARRDVTVDSRLPSRLHAFTDGEMPGSGGLSAQDHVIFQRGAARDPDLRAK